MSETEHDREHQPEHDREHDVPRPAARDAALRALLTAREGTGHAFPAALSARAREAGSEQVLADARAWSASDDPAARLVALELLGVLTAPWSPPAPDGVREELLAECSRAAGAVEEDLRWVAAKVAPHAGPDALAVLLVLAADPAEDVRWQAVSSLPLLAASAGEQVLGALLAAAQDEDDEVRDQAVFGLAVQLEVDAPAVRDALLRALSDPARPDTAATAARGLALRGDERVVPVLLEHLGAEDAAEVDDAWVEAAGELGDPRLLPALHRLAEEGWAADEQLAATLEAAITACSR